MARHKGLIQISGQVGDLVFLEQKGKRIVKSKSTKPIQQTEASKKSSVDFGTACKASARIRKAIRPLSSKYADDTFINRLNKKLIAILSTISKEFAGKKELVNGDVALLKDFQLSSLRRLDSFLWKAPIISIIPNDEIQIVIVEGNPSNLFKKVAKAINIVLELMVYNMDLNGENDQILPELPLVIPFEGEFKGATLRLPLDLNGERLVMVGIGIHYLSKEFEIGARNTQAGGIVFAAKFTDGIEVPFIPIEAKPVKAETKVEGTSWVLGIK